MTDSGHVLCPSSGSCHHIVASSLLSGHGWQACPIYFATFCANYRPGGPGGRVSVYCICGHNFLAMTRLLIQRRHYKFQWCTVPKVIDFPTYNTKYSGENEILLGIVRVVSHFVLYLGNVDYFLDSAPPLPTPRLEQGFGEIGNNQEQPSWNFLNLNTSFKETVSQDLLAKIHYLGTIGFCYWHAHFFIYFII